MSYLWSTLYLWPCNSNYPDFFLIIKTVFPTFYLMPLKLCSFHHGQLLPKIYPMSKLYTVPNLRSKLNHGIRGLLKMNTYFHTCGRIKRCILFDFSRCVLIILTSHYGMCVCSALWTLSKLPHSSLSEIFNSVLHYPKDMIYLNVHLRG